MQTNSSWVFIEIASLFNKVKQLVENRSVFHRTPELLMRDQPTISCGPFPRSLTKKKIGKIIKLIGWKQKIKNKK